MKLNKILALLLSGVMLVNVAVSTAVAAESSNKAEETEEIVVPLADYTKIEYSSPYEKLATMTLYCENDKFELWGLEETGEIALVTKSTGQILFSNPYDVASMSKDDKTTETKYRLLSQIAIKYSTGSGEATMYSYKEAALNRQISMQPIRGGLQVDYTMGREQARILVPELIEKSRFENEILEKMPQKDENGRTFVDEVINKNPYTYMKAYFQLKDANSEKLSEESRKKMMQTFPITKKYAVYMITMGTTVKEKKNLEHLITTYTDYTFDDLEADHEKVEFETSNAKLPLFKASIEYYLDDEGLKVRVPANNIRFDSTSFSIRTVTVLPYFGAGVNGEDGYTLISDGAGSIVKFEDAEKSNAELNISSKVYGQDYSFHQISGANQEQMRLPAYGVIRESEFYTFDKEGYDAAIESGELVAYDDVETIKAQMIAEANGETTEPKVEPEEPTAETEANTDADAAEGEEGEENSTEFLAQSYPFVNYDETKQIKAGYVAYIEEGESMAEITTSHGGITHKYHSAYATFTPRPTDAYELTGISATGNAMWSVTADRKYAGNFTIRFIPVEGEQATTAGMAAALRDYLVNKGVLTKLDESGSEDIPLYIENFGSIGTTKRLAGIPYGVQTPLTTFDDCIEVLTELKNGITVDKGTENERTISVPNVVVKYTGWYNGGLYKTVPTKFKVDKAIGGEEGLSKLLAFASENGFKIYPDVEYTYVNKTGFGDGFNYKDDSVQTIDGRTSEHKTYSALFQQYEPDGQLILSPTAMLKFYEKAGDQYAKFGIGGMSVASLGAELSSDHNDDYPLTREDSKETVTALLSRIKEDNGSVLVSGGNAYALPYVDHIINMPLTSSENVFASEAVPFYGMVLHGYKNYAGTAINLDGDFEKSLLKAIESGASPYFILSARNENTSELKSFKDFSKYYSIRYNIWREDLAKTYETLNEALKDVKYETITSHEYLDTRVVKVQYSNGTTFLLNYNTNPVEIDGVAIEAMGFVKQ